MKRALPAPVETGTKRPSSLDTWIAHGAIGAANATAITAPAATPERTPRSTATLISASSASATPNSRYSGRTSALAPISAPGTSHAHDRPPVERPQEREHGAGHRHLGQRLAQQPPGVEHERGVGGREQRGQQPAGRAAQPAAEQVADHDRDQAEQRDRQPPEPGVDAAGQVVDPRVEQRRAGRPVIGGVGAGDREPLVGVQQRGDPLVAGGVGSLVGGVDRVEDPDQPQTEAHEQDEAEHHENDAAVALWQRPDTPHSGRFYEWRLR